MRWLLSILLLSSCAAPHKTVAIANLKYDCALFSPQAKTQEDVQAVMVKSIEAIERARGRNDIALARSLKAARELRDIRRLEELIATDECSR